MIKNPLIALVLASFVFMFYHLYMSYEPKTELSGIAAHYAEHGAAEVGAANLVTAVVVTYRGFDTMGEVTILFFTASIISFFLKLSKKDEEKVIVHRGTSELLVTASQILIPIIFLFGIYVFINGHLTPGGGFQGGAIIATGLLLMMMAYKDFEIRHNILTWVESIAGITFVSLGLTGLIYGKTFLENFLPTGNLNDVVSGGIIPIIYIAVGFKVAAELAGVLETLLSNKEND